MLQLVGSSASTGSDSTAFHSSRMGVQSQAERLWDATHKVLDGGKVESATVLESIAEVAIALAGFGGIAAGLGYRARGDWTRDDQVRLIGLALFGLAVAFACFLPFLARGLGAEAPFRTASALFLPIPTAGFLFQIWFNRHGVPPGYSKLASLLNFVALVSASVLLLIVVFGQPAEPAFGFYFAAILATLFHTSVLFVRLLITSFRGNTPAVQ